MMKGNIVKETLDHRETVPIPYYLNFTPNLEKKLKNHFQTDNLNKFLGNHIYWTSVVKNIPDNIIDGKYTDNFGVEWINVGATRGIPKHHPLTEPNLNGYNFPEPLQDKRKKELENELSENYELFKLVKIGDLYERANFMRGMTNLIVDMYKHPKFVEDLLDQILQYNLSVLTKIQNLDIDGIWLSDDYGHQNGLLISPKLWRHFIKPRLQILFDKIKDVGFYTFLHSDGDIKDIIPDLIELKIDAIHPVQPEIMDLITLKKKFGNQLTFFGCFSTQETLPHKKPETIKQTVKQVINIMGRKGGFIISPGIGFLDDVPLENAFAFIDEVTNNRGIESNSTKKTL
ncbi:uroporphyrinogen decarboxylase family protein [[Eubacterium] cellulosolvens]